MKMKACIIACILLLVTGNIFAQSPQLYIGGKAGLGLITGQGGAVLGGNLNPIQLDWQMTKFFVLGTGMGFYFAPQTNQTALKQTDPGSGIMETYAGMETHMVFPLILKANFKPSIFSVEFGGGLYVSPVLMNTTVEKTNNNGYTVSEAYGKKLFSVDHPNPFGLIASGSFGVKIGKGILFLDLSYLRDFSEVTVKFNDENIGHHLWNMLAANIGYKHGILSK
ncbi:hypothetical protein [Treponema primitia]|uniref:hypothetical protein n=1 Tax=Treponema primitia TaxID=88058 RepID=UPI00025552BA|nr:hypothetical protein [Treponema primitia]